MRALLKADATFTVAEPDIPGIADPDADVTYTLRPITRAQMSEIAARHTKREVDRRTRQMVDTTDHEAAGADMLDYCLMGWSGITLDGEPAPCTREWKLQGLSMPVQGAIVAFCLDARGEVAQRKSFRATA